MATGMPPTLRQRRLGSELRKMRERAGLSSTAAAAHVGVQQARMSMIEAGRYAVSADRVRALAHTYACDDTDLVEALAAMTGGRGRAWWDEYPRIAPGGARGGRGVRAPRHRTAGGSRGGDARAAPDAGPREPETTYTAIVHEAALRMGVGGPEVKRRQLEHLIVMGERSNVKVLVVPFERADFPISGQPISYASGPVPQLDTVLLDSDHGCDLLDAEAKLARYRCVLDRMEACALSSGKSRDFIRRVVRST